MIRPIALAVLLTFSGSALAQQASTPVPINDAQAQTGQPPKRIRNVTLTAGQKCPQSTGDEVVVCGTINPEEQYRIPKALRDTAEPTAANQSWVNRTATADEVGRVAGGLPDTCSPVGTGGQSGCSMQRARAYAAEKRAAQKNDAMVP